MRCLNFESDVQVEVYLNGKLQAILLEKDFTAEPVTKVGLNKESTLSFSVDRYNEKAKFLTSEAKLKADGRMYTLRGENCLESDFSVKDEIRVNANELYKDLEDVFPFPYITNDPNTPEPADFATIIVGGGSDLSAGKFKVGTAGHALYAILNSTDWEVGSVDIEDIRDLEVEKKSVLGLIQEIQNIWGGFLVFDSVNKVVHLRDDEKWRTDNKLEINENKYVSVTKTVVGKVYNRVFPFGKDWLDIASVNEGKKYIDTHSGALTDIHSTQVVNQGISEQEELLKWGRQQGQLLARERYNYSCDVVDLRFLDGFESEWFDLGDIVTIHPRDSEKSKVRILSVERNLLLPFKVKIELGDPIDRLEDILKANIDATKDNSLVINGGKIDGRFLINSSIIADKIEEAALDASKFNVKQLILTGEQWSDDGVNRSIGWNNHKLFYDGKVYNISAGYTKKKYVVWRYGKSVYESLTENDFANKPLGDNDFVIAVNNDGIHDVAWFNRPARQFIGSTFIADAAITDAKIAYLSAVKITTGLLRSANGDTWINMDTGDFSFKNGALKWDSAKKELVIGGIDDKLNDVKNDLKNTIDTSYNDLNVKIDNVKSDFEVKLEAKASEVLRQLDGTNKLWRVSDRSSLNLNGINGKSWAEVTPNRPNGTDHNGEVAIVDFGIGDANYKNMFVYYSGRGWIPFINSDFLEENKNYNGVKISASNGIQIFNGSGVLGSELNKDHLRFYGVGNRLEESFKSVVPFTNLSNEGLQFAGANGTSYYIKDLYCINTPYYIINAKRDETPREIYNKAERYLTLPERFKNYDVNKMVVLASLRNSDNHYYDYNNSSSPYLDVRKLVVDSKTIVEAQISKNTETDGSVLVTYHSYILEELAYYSIFGFADPSREERQGYPLTRTGITVEKDGYSTEFSAFGLQSMILVLAF